MKHAHWEIASVLDYIAEHGTQAAPPDDVSACPECSRLFSAAASSLEAGKDSWLKSVPEPKTNKLPGNRAEFESFIGIDQPITTTDEKSSVTPLPPRPLWRQPAFSLAAAAALVVSAGLFNYYGQGLTATGGLSLSFDVAVQRPGLFFGNRELTTNAPLPGDLVTARKRAKLKIGRDTVAEVTGGSSFSFENQEAYVNLKIASGDFRLTFNKSDRKRTVIMGGQELSITGTVLYLSRSKTEAYIFVEEGQVQTKTGPLQKGVVYSLQDGKGPVKVPGAKKQLKRFGTAFPKKFKTQAQTGVMSLQEIREKYNNLSRVKLYDGRTITGAVIGTGNVYTIRTTKGITKIPKKDIKQILQVP